MKPIWSYVIDGIAFGIGAGVASVIVYGLNPADKPWPGWIATILKYVIYVIIFVIVKMIIDAIRERKNVTRKHKQKQNEK